MTNEERKKIIESSKQIVAKTNAKVKEAIKRLNLLL